MNAKKFLQSIYGNNVKEVFYRIAERYPYRAMPIEEAVEKINADIEEMIELLSGYVTDDELDNKAQRAAFGIWRNHLWNAK
jgi:hypothetical protein